MEKVGIAEALRKAIKQEMTRDERVLNLAEKYLTLRDVLNVEDRMIGTGLIGGKAVGMLLARAIIRKPELMILDEPTASLDSTTEAEVMQTLWKVMEERSTLIISHRLALVRPLDRILVIDDGRLVEEGSHDELVAQGGLYATLWHEQYGGTVQ